MKKHSNGDLIKLYNECEAADKSVFNEMRTNLLIMSGKHYQKTSDQLDRGMRKAGASKAKRLRLVKNHTQKAINDVKDIYSSIVPGVLPVPRLDVEMSHQKAAELAKPVWEYGKKENNWFDFKDKTVDNFTELGECCSEISFKPNKGNLKAYGQKVDIIDGKKVPLFETRSGEVTSKATAEVLDPVTGMVVDEIPNQPLKDETKPIFRGMVEIDRFSPFDLLRPKSANSIKTAPYLIRRLMMSKDEVKGLIEKSNLEEEEKQERIDQLSSGGESTYQVFNGNSGSFQEDEDQVMVRKYYFRQCYKYPKGYFYISTESGILFEGPLPFGEFGEIAFPIKWEGHDQFETSARGFSPIKRVRPAQIEVNRCASSVAETQSAVGWDKIITKGGTRVERGIDQVGIRHFKVNGGDFQVVQGRGGEQFMGYLEHNVNEIYELLHISQNSKETSQSFDPKSMLVKNHAQRKHFTKPASKLSRYLVGVVETYLFLAQKYLDEDDLKSIIGSAASVDMAEFKNIDRSDYKIDMEEVSDDIDSMVGKMIELDTIVQYVGKDLSPEERGILLTQFPYLNKQKVFSKLDYVLEDQNIESDILAIERGEYREANKDDNHNLYVKRITNLMKSRSFLDKDPAIKQMFMQKRSDHQKFVTMAIEETRKANAGLIPTGGGLVKLDYYITNSKGKQERATAPTGAVEWLLEHLDGQGLHQERLAEATVSQLQAMVPQGPPEQQPQGPQMNQQPVMPQGQMLNPQQMMPSI